MISLEPPVKALARVFDVDRPGPVRRGGRSPAPAVRRSRLHRRVVFAVGVLPALIVVAACTTTAPRLGSVDLEAARVLLSRPLTADPAALYRLRIPASGGLRLAVMMSGEDGRLTVSEPFGSAVSLLAWEDLQPPTFYDLKEGCRVEAANLEQALGVAAMPLPQAVRLMVGRLPAIAGDEVSENPDGRLLVSGRGWTALVSVAPDPWRVVAVEDGNPDVAGWKISLDDHNGSLPGQIRVKKTGGRWAELDLVRLEWSPSAQLPALPDLPLCVFKDRQ